MSLTPTIIFSLTPLISMSAILFPARESLVIDIPDGDGKIAKTFLYSVSLRLRRTKKPQFISEFSKQKQIRRSNSNNQGQSIETKIEKKEVKRKVMKTGKCLFAQTARKM